MKTIIPMIRLDDKESIPPVRTINSGIMVVRVQDLITKGTAQLNELFYKIKRDGGIHKHLDYRGKVILSTIMRDDLLKKVGTPIYSDLIEYLKPDYVFSIDCETYDNEHSYSIKEIRSSLIKTLEIRRLFPEIKIIGLVKGCDRNQILKHYKILKGIFGIDIFAIHTGDFFRNGDNNQIQKVKCYASLIKKEDNVVLLAGFGSQTRLEEFSFADGCITYAHMINARKRIILEERKKIRNNKMTCGEACIHNLKQMKINLKNSEKQTKLEAFNKKWVVEQEA